jgi:hypothetical protein
MKGRAWNEQSILASGVNLVIIVLTCTLPLPGRGGGDLERPEDKHRDIVRLGSAPRVRFQGLANDGDDL